MKLMFISDIHGLAVNLEKIEKKFKILECDKLVVLGDILYPHNSIEVVNFINKYSNKIIAVCGNCDSYQNNDCLNISIDKELNYVVVDELKLYISHGHIYNEDTWQLENSILIYGHLHKPFIRKKNTNLFLNPGSISLPRGIYTASYMIYNNHKFTIYDINDIEIDNISI